MRSSLDFGLRMDNQFFQGMVLVDSCDAMRNLYYVWRHYRPSSTFLHFLNLPKIYGPLAVDYFKSEIIKFKAALEEYSDHSVKDSDLVEAVRIYNETRDLLDKLYQMRKQVPPLLKGAMAAKVVRASQTMPKRDFNQKLSKFLEEVGK